MTCARGLSCIESSVKLPGVPDDVRKQFKEMILDDKYSASASDAQPATSSDNDTSSNGTTFDIFLHVAIWFQALLYINQYIHLMC